MSTLVVSLDILQTNSKLYCTLIVSFNILQTNSNFLVPWLFRFIYFTPTPILLYLGCFVRRNYIVNIYLVTETTKIDIYTHHQLREPGSPKSFLEKHLSFHNLHFHVFGCAELTNCWFLPFYGYACEFVEASVDWP